MSRPQDDDAILLSIDLADLDTVTGGTASNDDVASAIQSLSTNLSDFINSQKNQTSNLFTQMMPFLLMMAGGGGGFSGGFGSCGGGGCCHRCGCSPCRCHR